MGKLVAILIAALLLPACGAAPIGPAPIGPPPTPTLPAGGYAAVLTNSDRTASVRVGEKVEVVLRASAGMANWSYPTSSDESVLAPVVDPAATEALGVTLAAFQARVAGQANITSTAGPNCPAGQPCPQYLVLYSATVTVTS